MIVLTTTEGAKERPPRPIVPRSSIWGCWSDATRQNSKQLGALLCHTQSREFPRFSTTFRSFYFPLFSAFLEIEAIPQVGSIRFGSPRIHDYSAETEWEEMWLHTQDRNGSLYEFVFCLMGVCSYLATFTHSGHGIIIILPADPGANVCTILNIEAAKPTNTS